MLCPTSILDSFCSSASRNSKSRPRASILKGMTNQEIVLKPPAKAKSNSELGCVYRYSRLAASSFIKSSFSRCPFQILESCSCNSIKVFLSDVNSLIIRLVLRSLTYSFYATGGKLLKIPNRGKSSFTIRSFSLKPRQTRNSTRDLSWWGSLGYQPATGCGLTPQYQDFKNSMITVRTRFEIL